MPYAYTEAEVVGRLPGNLLGLAYTDEVEVVRVYHGGFIDRAAPTQFAFMVDEDPPDGVCDFDFLELQCLDSGDLDWPHALVSLVTEQSDLSIVPALIQSLINVGAIEVTGGVTEWNGPAVAVRAVPRAAFVRAVAMAIKNGCVAPL